MSREEKTPAPLCWQWHADPYLPTTFSIKGIGTDLLSAGSCSHTPSHGAYYPISSRKVQNCWDTDSAVQLPHGHSIIGQDWLESCSIGKWHPVEIKMSHLQFWLVPGLSLACPSAHCTSTKLRAEELPGCEGAGEAGRDMACSSLTYFFEVWQLWEEGAVWRESHKGSGLGVQSRAEDEYDRCHDTITSRKTCGVGVAQVGSHSMAVLPEHHLLVSLHKHSSKQGSSQHELPKISLSSLQLMLTSQECRHASQSSCKHLLAQMPQFSRINQGTE